MNRTITVIIPAYNVERFVEKAILSALDQKEVSEIVVVNDGSTDNTDVIVTQLAHNNPRLKVYYHPNKVNKGRSASRNLALSKATSTYIAFLDADDFYLENRFKNDTKILDSDSNVDGIYNAIGVHFYRDYTPTEFEERKITTLTKRLDSKELFEPLLHSRYGHFSIDGYLLKKSLLDTVGNFDENLKVGEDKIFILKTVLKGKIVAGLLATPVAVRGIHEDNVFNNKSVYTSYQYKIYESLLFWCFHNSISKKYMEHILDVLWNLRYAHKKGFLKNNRYWMFLFSKKPTLMFSKLGLKYFPLIRRRKVIFSFLYNR